MDPSWATLFSKLIDVSPYLALLVAMAVIFYWIFKVAINAYQKISEKSIEESRQFLQEAIREIRLAYGDKK